MARRRASVPAFLLLLGVAPLPALAANAPVGVERLELDARIDPSGPALYAKANMVLRNRSRAPVELVEFQLPAPLGARTVVENVWDRNGQLAWRSDAVEADQPLAITVALRLPLPPGDRQRIVISFAMKLEGLAPPTAAQVSAQSARLATSGWYPALADAGAAQPEWIRLTVRLPKDWRVEGATKPKRVLVGEASASYEITLQHLTPDALLFAATAPAAK